MLELIKAATRPILDGVLRLIPDKNARAEAAEAFDAQLLVALTGIVQGQLEVNKAEAQHSSVFVAGWRPAIGWICGAGLAWNYIIAPLLSWIAFAFGAKLADAPSLDISELLTLLAGMLGLGAYRTYEKRAGVARSSL